MRRKLISINEYYDFSTKIDMSPSYLPDLIEFYFYQLKKKPKIIGQFNKQAKLVAAYPVLYGQIFPNSLHKRIMGQKYLKLGDIGQPEIFFPVLRSVSKLSLNCLSPTTSPLLSGIVRGFYRYSIKSITIAKKTKHKNATRAQRLLFNDGGKVYFTDEIEKNDFADIYIKLHSKRWGYLPEDLRYVRQQILKLYNHIHGGVLFQYNEPLAAQLCFKFEGQKIYYVDFINIGVKSRDKRLSYGSIMMLSTLRKAEEQSRLLGKNLRFSFGYYYGKRDYKNLWADPEPTFVGF